MLSFWGRAKIEIDDKFLGTEGRVENYILMSIMAKNKCLCIMFNFTVKHSTIIKMIYI